MAMEIQQHKNQARALKDANAEIARLRAKISEQTGGKDLREPIAIIGMGCRFPGGVRTRLKTFGAYCNQAATCCATYQVIAGTSMSTIIQW